MQLITGYCMSVVKIATFLSTTESIVSDFIPVIINGLVSSSCMTPWNVLRHQCLTNSPPPDQQDYKCLTKLNVLGVGWVGWYKGYKFQSKVLVNVKQFRNSHHAYIGGCDIMSLLIFKLEEGETRHGQGFELKAFLRIKYPTPGTLWLVKRKLLLYPSPYM